MDKKIIIGSIITAVVIILGGIILATRGVPRASGPTYERSQLLLSDTNTKGPKDAKVYLVEFSDFQCPACKAYKDEIDTLTAKHKDDLLFAFRHFPLPQHEYAIRSAETAEAVGEQGKFWEFYDFLFQNQSALQDQFIIDSGKNLVANSSLYYTAIITGKFKTKVQRDFEDGRAFGVTGTPTFFLNGKRLDVSSPQALSQAVEGALSSK